jgi:hypothetical protein
MATPPDPAEVFLAKAREDLYLVKKIKDDGTSVDLTPFGAELRYDYLPKEELEAAPFDREATTRLAESAIEWAAKIVREK